MTKPMKTFTLSILTCFMGVAAVAQQASSERDFMDKVFKPVSEKEAAYYRDIISIEDGFGGSIYWINGDLRMTGFYNNKIDGEFVKHGNFVFYYADGTVESSGYYENGIKVSAWKRFTANGTPRTDRYYKPESADFIRDAMAGK